MKTIFLLSHKTRAYPFVTEPLRAFEDKAAAEDLVKLLGSKVEGELIITELGFKEQDLMKTVEALKAAMASIYDGLDDDEDDGEAAEIFAFPTPLAPSVVGEAE